MTIFSSRWARLLLVALLPSAPAAIEELLALAAEADAALEADAETEAEASEDAAAAADDVGTREEADDGTAEVADGSEEVVLALAVALVAVSPP